MTKLPFGSWSTMMAATCSSIFSLRSTLPVPVLLLVLLMSMSLLGSKPSGMMPPTAVSSPKKWGMPAVSPLSRARVVVLSIFALSSMLMTTVMMSPTLEARWSLKKARAPDCQSDAVCGCGGGCTGIGRFTER